jgi:hypothetical protein
LEAGRGLEQEETGGAEGWRQEEDLNRRRQRERRVGGRRQEEDLNRREQRERRVGGRKRT